MTTFEKASMGLIYDKTYLTDSQRYWNKRMRLQTAKAKRQVREALKTRGADCTCSTCEAQAQDRELTDSNMFRGVYYGLLFTALIMALVFGCGKMAHASETIAGYSTDQWADAIYKAEHSKNHPYGIMIKYVHTSPRNACKHTLAHYWRDYSKLPYKTRQSKRFLTYAQERYAPIGANNDPTDLNRNWQRNVEYWLKHSKKG